MSSLSAWSTFYVTIGTSAASLTGLTFVIITLVAGTRRVARSPGGVSSFSTPTVVHFCAALLVSAIMVAPWRSLGIVAILLGLAGLYGVIYIVRVMAATRRLDTTTYTPDFEDWAWYGLIPLLAYGAILGGAIALPALAQKALFAVAGGAVLLIFTGIRNSWDVVTFIAVADTPPPES